MSTMNISPARRAEIVRRRTGQPARLWHQQRVCPRIDPQGQGPPATARLAAGRRDFRADQARRRELFRRIARPHPTKHEIGRLADMSAKPIIPRTRAEQDIDEAITHYLDEQRPGRHQDSSTRWKPRIATLPAIPLPVPADTRTSWISRTCARGLCRATLSWFLRRMSTTHRRMARASYPARSAGLVAGIRLKEGARRHP